MAALFANKVSPVSNVSNVSNGNFKKADMFVNLSIELADGSKLQFGEKGVALYNDKRTDAAHIKRLTEGGPEAIEALLKVLKISVFIPSAAPDVSNVGY